MEIDTNRKTTLAFRLLAINPSAFGGIIFKGATPEHTESILNSVYKAASRFEISKNRIVNWYNRITEIRQT